MRTHAALQFKAQRGVGLIEVLISVTVGLVLLLGVSQYFLSMRQTATSTQKLSALQNQQRMAMYFLHAAVAGAGNVPDPGTTPGAVLYPINTKFAILGQSLFGLGPTGTTTLRTRFTASAGSSQGCSATLTPGTVYTDEFSVTSDGYLTCVETPDAGASTTIQLVGDAVNKITNMTIRYGVDTTTQNNPNISTVPLSAVQYLTADQVTAALWPFVMTVEITLEFMDPLAGQVGIGATAKKTLVETIPYMGNI